MTLILFVMNIVLVAMFGPELAIPSQLMGLGIAIDVTLATVAKFRDKNLGFWNWTFPITCTHIGFPAIGYYGFWGLSEAYPMASPILGLIGALLVVLFIYEVFCDWIGVEPVFGISAAIGKIAGFEENDARRMVAIMAVSWDALWSGPAKAAQAVEAGWTDFEVLVSFGIAGAFVAFAAQLALMMARRLNKRQFKDAVKMARYSNFGKFVETSVIGGFGVMSFLMGFSISENIYLSIAIAAIIMALLFAIFAGRLRASALEEAEEAIAGDETEVVPAAA